MPEHELRVDPDAIPCRRGEELPTEKLEPHLHEGLPGAAGPLDVLQFPHEHANLTYLLRFGGREFVLRQPPFGPVAPESHEMGRGGEAASARFCVPRTGHSDRWGGPRGRSLRDWEHADRALEAFALYAGPEHDAELVRIFHRWCRRQGALFDGLVQVPNLVRGVQPFREMLR